MECHEFQSKLKAAIAKAKAIKANGCGSIQVGPSSMVYELLKAVGPLSRRDIVACVPFTAVQTRNAIVHLKERGKLQEQGPRGRYLYSIKQPKTAPKIDAPLVDRALAKMMQAKRKG